MTLKKFGIALLLFLLFAFPVRADSPTVSDISKQLICQCGCGRTLDSHICETQEDMVARIEQKLAEGQSEEETLQFFVDQYGEEVLAAPPKRGFNLTAWLLPFAVILAGGVTIYIALKKWVRKGKESQAMAAVETGEGDEEYQRRLDKELKEFTERGFR
jgi:cytochrome c-type biogenesis protein CcmH